MRRVALEKVVPGVKLARTIFSLDGRVLLNSGVELRESYIRRLLECGITEVYIEDSISADIDIRELVCEHTRVYAKQHVKKIMSFYGTSLDENFSAVSKSVDSIIDELFTNRDIMINLADIKSVDDYTFEHCVNVCVLSLIIGIRMGYNKYRLKELGVGAILHDIGKLKISESILKKPAQLTEEEFGEIKKHTTYGYELLKRIPGISTVSVCIAYMHHERIDGSGYPLGLQGENVHECARIVAVADVFDALTSDRVYRKKLRHHEVVEYLTSTAVSHFDRNIIECFTQCVSLYPPGSGVILNTGEKGLVVSANRTEPSKPVVRIIFDPEGNELVDFYEINLLEDSSLFVAEACDL